MIVFLGAPKANYKIFGKISQSFAILLMNEKGRYMNSGKLLLIIIFFITCVGDGIAQQQVAKNFVPQPFKCKLCDSASRIVAVDAAEDSLTKFDVLVIANALSEKNSDNWDLPRAELQCLAKLACLPRKLSQKITRLGRWE